MNNCILRYAWGSFVGIAIVLTTIAVVMKRQDKSRIEPSALDSAKASRVLIIQAIWNECNGYREEFGKFPKIIRLCDDVPNRNWRLSLLAFSLARQAKFLEDNTHSEIDEKRRQLYQRGARFLGSCDGLATDQELESIMSEMTLSKNRVRDASVLSARVATHSVLAVSGPNTAFDANEDDKLDIVSRDLIVLIEGKTTALPWWKSEAATNVESLNEVGKENSRGFLIAFVDGTIWCMRKETPKELLRQFMTIDSALNQEREEILERWRCR